MSSITQPTATTTQVAPLNLLLLAVLSLIWGTAFVFIHQGLSSFSPVFFAALRFDIAGPLLLGATYVVSRTQWLPHGGKQWLAVSVTAVLNIVGYHALLYWGQQHTYEAVAAVIVALNPSLTTVFSRALLPGERVGPLGVAGLVVGLCGIALLALFKPGALFDLRGLGELAVAGAITCWALGTVVSRRIDHKLPPATLTAWQMILGAVLLHLGSAWAEPHATATWTVASVGALLYLAVLSSAVGYFLFFTLVSRVGPIRAALVSTLSPVWATLAGVVLLGDPLELRMVLAFTLILGAFALVVRPARARALDA